MLASVITPARNAASTISLCIKSVSNQNVDFNYEHIIIEDGSKDDTKEIILKHSKSLDNLKFLKGPNTGPSGARNLGIKNAEGEIIVFIDADCKADSDWLENIIEPFQDERIYGVCGSVKTPEDIGLTGKIIGLDWEYRQEGDIVKKKKWFHMMNTAYRRKAFNEAGFLDEKLKTGEDVEFFKRVQKREFELLYHPEAIVYHYHRDTLGKYLKQFFIYGRGSFKVLKKTKNINLLIIPAYFLSLLLLLIFSPLNKILAAISLILLFIGLANFVYNGIKVYYKSKELPSLLIGPLSFLGRFSKFLGFLAAIIKRS